MLKRKVHSGRSLTEGLFPKEPAKPGTGTGCLSLQTSMVFTIVQSFSANREEIGNDFVLCFSLLLYDWLEG